MIANPRDFEPADQVEQPLHVLARQAAGRLIEHQHAASNGNRPGHLHQLLFGDRKASDRQVQAEYPPAPPPPSPRRLFRAVGRGSDKRAKSRLHAEHDIFRHRQMRRQRQFLIDHRHAKPPALQRAAEGRRAGRPVPSSRHPADARPTVPSSTCFCPRHFPRPGPGLHRS